MPTTQPPSTVGATTVEIGAIVPALTHLSADASQTVLRGFRRAYLGRRITAKGRLYSIVDVFLNRANPSRIMARLIEISGQEK